LQNCGRSPACHVGQEYCRSHRLLEGILMDMVASRLTRSRIFGQAFCGKHILPPPFRTRTGILPLKRIGEIDTSVSLGHILLMKEFYPFQTAGMIK
jgi:hypothetical protein